MYNQHFINMRINHYIKDAVLYGNTTYGITAFKLTQHTRILSISLVCVL